MKTEIEKLKELIVIQGSAGNWDYDPYMHGLYNGMVMALSIFTGDDPGFREAPPEWIRDKRGTKPAPLAQYELPEGGQ